MMKTGSIYRIYNRIDGKSYIGATTKDVNQTRIKHHLSGRSECRALVEAINEHGIDAFDWQIIESNVENDRLSQTEIHYICAFNTLHPHGYNLKLGNKHCDETRRRIGDAHRGRSFSAETRRRMSQSTKGEKHPNYGKSLSAETRRKIGEANSRRIITDETRQKLSKAHIGITHSEESRAKISRAKRGKPRSPETRRRISESLKRRSQQSS